MRIYENDFDQYEFDEYHYVYDDQPGEDAYEGLPQKYFTLSKKALALMMALCIAVSGAFGIGGAYITSKTMSSAPVSFQGVNYVVPMYADLATATGSELTIQQIINLAADAVVEIVTERVTTDFFMRELVRPGAGSGVILTSDGYIMTNNHVVRGSGRISVTLRSGARHEATLVGHDTQTDVAVIKIEANGLTPVVFGDSDAIVMGDLAVAIGNPLGELGGTATAGIISSLDRRIRLEGQTMNLLQTDAAINQGNSGGGLFNQYGEIIGLVVAKSQGLGVEGLGFAIPINTAKTVAAQLIDVGYVTGRPQIGIEMIDLSQVQDAIRHGARNPGIYVSRVLSEGARNAGFQEGDMLYYLEDIRIEKFSDLTDGLMKHKVGDTVNVTVVRGNDMVILSVVLSEQRAN